IKHEAVMKVLSDKYEEGIVAEEVRRGYILNGKVLRPAMVKVAEKPKEEKQSEKGGGKDG
ncbi:MAG: nucleotide exchange factor GrpE, partial [Candidatus Omnitrophica bacterium]|nr:nucleotide exchange factor GrpE [Candidatus Omnitrophota bacterium]